MNKQLLDEVRAAVSVHDTPERRLAYAVAGHSDTRYRWDLFWLSGFDVVRLYSADLNDNHIDTALRNIVGTL